MARSSVATPGRSLWNWSTLPATISQRYRDYARANASIGINGTVLNNVNSNAQILSAANLDKVAALATAFRPYGISVYLSARFSAPIELGGLTTADPLASNVQQWWATKVSEIYTKIPDFGGFPREGKLRGTTGAARLRTHACRRRKMLSDALGSRGGIVLWRAFVYSDTGTDRIRQAYDEFKPLDGQLGANALVQVKNGPLDFQPREPFSPLFGGLTSTPVALELQITKEYLGQDTHLAYLGSLVRGGPEIRHVRRRAGVARSARRRRERAPRHEQRNLRGFQRRQRHELDRFAFQSGQLVRLRPHGMGSDASARDVADEWIRQTFSNDPVVLGPVTTLMMASHQALVNYMTPLGLAHIMGTDHHYGPAPWVNNLSTANWNPFYYHKADSTGIGFNRTSSSGGSNAVSQYFTTVRDRFASRATVPDDLLLFFHRVGWDDTLSSSGRSSGTSSFIATASASTRCRRCATVGRWRKGASTPGASTR